MLYARIVPRLDPGNPEPQLTMALTQRLEIRQGQALVMTPQLMQAIKLLQLSSLDLVAYVEAELERNPLLDRAPENEADAAGAAPEASSRRRERSEDIRSGDWLGEDLETSRDAIEQRLDTDLENVFPDDSAESPVRPAGGELPPASGWAAVGSGGRDGGEYNLEAFVDVGDARSPTTSPTSSRLPASTRPNA